MTSSKKKSLIFLVSIGICASFLFFSNLGNTYLWQDEAQTALVSKTIIQDGIPRGFDGKNFFSQELGAEYGKNYIWKWHTWFPFYLLAGFFKAFGVSTFTARLPFAIFGMGCLILVYLFSKSLWKNNVAAMMAAALLSFSVPFLILSRQCRYYSLTAFFSLGALYGYHLMLGKKRFGPALYFICSIFLFHTHYIYLATLMGSIAIHVLLFHRNQWKRILLWSICIIAINLPWIIWLSDMKYGEQYEGQLLDWGFFIFKVKAFGELTFEHIFPLYILVIPFAVGLMSVLNKKLKPFWKESEAASVFCLPTLFIITTFMAVSLTAPVPFFRYLAPLIPLLIMIIGYFLALAARLHSSIALLVFGCLIFFSPIHLFLHEITHDFDGPIEGIVSYLQEHSKKDDTVAITYGDLPIKFYTELRVIGGLTGEDLTPAIDADWIILRKNIHCKKEYKVGVFLANNVNWRNYTKIILNYPDTTFENREEPDKHLFKTSSNCPPVILYKKIKQTDS